MNDMRITKKEVTIMLKNKPEKLQMFKVDYSVLKKKKLVNGFVMKILKFKPFSS